MATNYMTVAEAEIQDLEARLWRIKQAIEIKDPNFITNRIDDELMKMRFDATLKLAHIIYMQMNIWEIMDEKEKEALLASGKSADEILDEFEMVEPDYKIMPEAYKAQFDFADDDFIHPPLCWLSITRPEDSCWLDLPGKLKAKKKKAACMELKKRLDEDAYNKLMVEDELESMNTHAERYEEHLRYANGCSVKYDGKPLYTEDEIREKVNAETEYYKTLKKNKLEATGLYGKK